MDKGLEEERFSRAADRMRANTALKLTEKQRLELYGYYKQVYRPGYAVSNVNKTECIS